MRLKASERPDASLLRVLAERASVLMSPSVCTELITVRSPAARTASSLSSALTRQQQTNKCVFQQRTDKDLILVAPRGGDLDVKGESGTVMNVRLIS